MEGGAAALEVPAAAELVAAVRAASGTAVVMVVVAPEESVAAEAGWEGEGEGLRQASTAVTDLASFTWHAMYSSKKSRPSEPA